MKAESHNQRPKDRQSTISALNAATGALDLAEKSSTITPAKATFGIVSALLPTIRDSMVDEPHCIELGLLCADVCRALDRVTNGKKLDELGQSVRDAMNLSASTVADIETKLAKWGKRSAASRRFHAVHDREKIATWRLDLDKILQILNRELATNTNATISTTGHDVLNAHPVASDVQNDIANTRVSEIHPNLLKSPKDTRGQAQTTHARLAISPENRFEDIPTLSMGAARDTFYRIYDSDVRSGLVDRILGQLDFHPLSITLLATVAHQSKWDVTRLTTEWDRRRTSVLQTRHNRSLAAPIEVSLASSMFQDLGPDARGLLEVIAFFPQGVDESNVDWLFPTVPDGTSIVDTFCVLSLTYRSEGFVTMLAPLRDYLSPKDPKSSPLLCAAKECYFTRMSAIALPDKSNSGESQWIRSEDVNVEHLLDVFTTIDANSDSVWDACQYFIIHLNRHKPRPVILRPKIEGLPDSDFRKLKLLVHLSILSGSIGNQVERKQILMHALKLWQGWGDNQSVARIVAVILRQLSNSSRLLGFLKEGIQQAKEALEVLGLWQERGDDQSVTEMVTVILRQLSDSNRLLGFHKEGIQQAKAALEIHERLGEPTIQAEYLINLAWLMRDDNQLDAAEEAASRAIDLLPKEGQQLQVCKGHRALGAIYRSKGETEKAIHHFEVALGIASLLNRDDHLSGIHLLLAELFLNEGRFDDAQPHAEQAKSHAVNNAYDLGYAMELQTIVWHKQHRLEEARSEALRAIKVFEKLGAAKDLQDCRIILFVIQQELSDQATSGRSGFNPQETEAASGS